MIDINTVGAGGGSIAYRDAGGSLKVGPESAGADPGPICYGKGEQITVTDANLFLGRLAPDLFLGGDMRLETGRLEDHFTAMAAELNLTPTELAEGVLAVANANMEKAIRVISVERGFDPREFTLLSFGGAGGMHAAFLAKLLNIPKLFIPGNPGILSAIGMLMADIIKDYSLTVMLNQHNADREKLTTLFEDLDQKGRADLLQEGIDSQAILLERFLDMRYEGQSYEIIVPFEGDFLEGFHQLHEKTYGYRNQNKTVEMVNLRLRARGTPIKPVFERTDFVSETVSDDALEGSRTVIFDSKPMETMLYNRDKLVCGNKIAGPAIITEYSSTLVIPPFANGFVDGYGNLIFDIG
jgi:N-methylhydantoinase A